MKNRTFKIKAVKACVILALAGGSLAATAQASILNVTSLSITGGGFGFGNTGNAITAGNASPIVTGTYQGGTFDSATGGTYGGSGSTLTNFTYSGFPVYTYTAANSDNCQGTGCSGLIPGGPYAAPTGTVDTTADTITMNLPSWFATYGSTDFNVGTGNGQPSTSATATGTYNPTTGAYTLSWTSEVYQPQSLAFNGQVSDWTLSGIATVGSVAAVPLPATFWLMGSGLLGLVGVARRKSKTSSVTGAKTA